MADFVRRALAILTAVLCGCTAEAQSAQTQSASKTTEQVFTERLRTIAGAQAVDCGTTAASKPDDAVASCGLKAFHDHNAFFLGYYTRYAQEMEFAYGLAGDSSANIFMVSYEPRGFPAVAPTRHTRVLDNNHSRVAECIKPVTLDTTRRGLLACVTPVNREESERVAHQTPTDTTLCAVAEDPSAFNNKLVRLRGHFSGNFEYSMLSGDNCEQALWFGYGGGGGPPSLAAYVPGGARPGAEDADGRLVLPVPVKLVQDSKFETFEKQVQAMSNADAAYEKNTQASSSNTV